MEADLDNLGLKSDHSLQEQEMIIFNYSSEEILQKIKQKWSSYDVQKKKNLFKLLKCCYGEEDITNALKDLGEGNTIKLTEYETEEIPESSEDLANSEIEEEFEGEEEQEEDIIIKCSLKEMKKAFLKESIIIWHDPNANSQVNQRYLNKLREFCEVKTFTEWEKAVTEILEAKTACHVITSGTNGELLVKEIYMSENVSEIYIFCKNESYHSTWAQKYQKISGIKTQIQDIIDQIKQSLLKYEKQASSLKHNLPAFAPIFNNYDKSQMNNLHRYLKVIPNFKNRLQAKNDFLMLSRAIYSDEKKILEFEQNYKAYNKRDILRWFTKPCFLNKVTNNCLRVATSDSIQYCRLILHDLQRAIKEQYQTKSKSFNGLLYGEATFTEEEWSLLKQNISREIEMLGFLSAFKDADIALRLLQQDSNNKVLIKILVPKGPNEEEQGFAEIEEFSQHPVEKEVLFNVRSRFTILETEDEYSKDLPYRHLVLLYGAQGFRRYVAEQNPAREISIDNVDKRFCSQCKNNIQEAHSKMLFLSLTDLQNQTYCCQKCLPSWLEDHSDPLLCISMNDDDTESYTTSIRGVVLKYHDPKIPMYGYKCHGCQSTKQRFYFKCIECNQAKEKYCFNCVEIIQNCLQTKHAIVLENNPFSFWCEKMSESEINLSRIQDEILAKSNQLFIQAEMYFQNQEYQKAIEYYTSYIHQNQEKQIDSNLATAYNNIGLLYKNLGEYTKALEYISKALKIQESVYGENHPSTATSYNNIGLIFQKQREYPKALEHFSKALKIRESVYEGNHSEIATSYNNIGLIYQDQGEDTKALEYISKAFEIQKSFYGENHPETATSYNNIGHLYQSLGEYKKALEYISKALKIRESVYGENHLETATSYNNLGTFFLKQGEYTKALEYFLKCLNTRQLIYGENHPETATSYNNIGLLYKDQKEFPKGLEYCFKSLKIRELFYGENHPETAASYNNIGLLYQDQGEYTKALEYISKALKIQESVYGENHPETATYYGNIGFLYQDQGEYTKALESLFHALNIQKSVNEENQPLTATYLSKQEKLVFNYSLEQIIQKIKPKWDQYDVEKKKSLIKLLRRCYGKNITNALTYFKDSQVEENLKEGNLKEVSELSSDLMNSEIEDNENDEENEDEEIIKQIEIENEMKEFIKDYVIFWHDPNVNSLINQKYLDQLKKFCEVKTFTEWDKAVTEILEAKTSCHVITSGTNGEFLVKGIDSCQNVKEIYIFCKNKDYHSTWAQKYLKISCVETQIQDIIDKIKDYFCN